MIPVCRDHAQALCSSSGENLCSKDFTNPDPIQGIPSVIEEYPHTVSSPSESWGLHTTLSTSVTDKQWGFLRYVNCFTLRPWPTKLQLKYQMRATVKCFGLSQILCLSLDSIPHVNYPRWPHQVKTIIIFVSSSCLGSKKTQFGLYDPFLLVIPLLWPLHSLLDSLFVLPVSKVSFDELFETIDEDITKSFQ